MTVDKMTITNEIRLEGNTGPDALIQKNASEDRDELQIYACSDAYSSGSRGAGIHLYGNEDLKHHGNITFMTGDNDDGNARMTIGQSGNITIGSNIWDFVDEGKDIHLVNIVRDGVLVGHIDHEGNFSGSSDTTELEARISKIEEWISSF